MKDLEVEGKKWGLKWKVEAGRGFGKWKWEMKTNESLIRFGKVGGKSAKRWEENY